MSNAVRLGPGRYRLSAPAIPTSTSVSINNILKVTSKDSFSSSEESSNTRASLAPDIACVKMAAMSEKPTIRKRIYFTDRQPSISASKKPMRVIKSIKAKCQDSLSNKDEKANDGTFQNNAEEHNDGRGEEMLMDPTIDVVGYEEVGLTEEYNEGAGPSSMPSFISSDTREVISGNMFRELKGENAYLKEQLHASVLRAKQLEGLLIQRNSQVKKLVSENLQLSMKCRKLMTFMTEEEAREALELRLETAGTMRANDQLP